MLWLWADFWLASTQGQPAQLGVQQLMPIKSCEGGRKERVVWRDVSEQRAVLCLLGRVGFKHSMHPDMLASITAPPVLRELDEVCVGSTTHHLL